MEEAVDKMEEAVDKMNAVVGRVEKALQSSGLSFSKKPILIGGMAMEFYDIRKAGADIDLIIEDDDYQALARKHPEKKKDIYGDLGVVIDCFEIWRSITLFDYHFFKKDAIEREHIFIISVDRLLWTRVCAMEVGKYRKDLELLKEYYHKTYANEEFYREARLHEKLYSKGIP